MRWWAIALVALALGCMVTTLRPPRTAAEMLPVFVTVDVWEEVVDELSVECRRRVYRAPVYPSAHHFPYYAAEEAVYNTVVWLEHCEDRPGYWVADRAIARLARRYSWGTR